MCCSPWGHKESDTTERLKLAELRESDFEGQWDLIMNFQRTQGNILGGHTHTKSCAYQDPGESSSDPTGD